jgi:epoxyqueuosine reductase
MDARQVIEARASALGFGEIRFAAVGRAAHAERYAAWLEAGRHGELDYLERGRDVRQDPTARFPGARSAVVLAWHHHHRRPPDPGGRTGLVARYAWGRDYHNLVGKRLRRLRSQLREVGIESWGGVDTAPILERGWATAAGLGFAGRSTLQILPGRSSWFFLAVLFVDALVAPDAPLARDHCGACRRCLVACPTDAFVGSHELDATRCIAYWTIESRGLAPRSLRPAFGRWVFGCDVCQEVCPHNHHPPEPECDDLLPRNAWLDLDEVVLTPDDVLLERTRGTPLRRAAPCGLKRNALIALGNLGDDGGVDAARRGLEHPDPVVRGAAVWALARLGDARVMRHVDVDPLVQEEVRAAQGVGT